MVHNLSCYIEATSIYVAVCVWTNCFLECISKHIINHVWLTRSNSNHVTTSLYRQSQSNTITNILLIFIRNARLEIHLDGSKQLLILIHSYPVQLISQPHTWRCMSVYLGSRDLVPWRGASVHVTQVRAELQYSFLEVDGFVHIKPLQ